MKQFVGAAHKLLLALGVTYFRQVGSCLKGLKKIKDLKTTVFVAYTGGNAMNHYQQSTHSTKESGILHLISDFRNASMIRVQTQKLQKGLARLGIALVAVLSDT